MAENPRTTSARDHDDTDLIEGMIPDADALPGSAGGRLQTDIGSKAGLKRAIDDPEGDTPPEKQDDIDNGQAVPSGGDPNR